MPKSVFITGAAKRIGKAIALDMAYRGHSIYLHYNRSADAASQTRSELLQAGAASVELVQGDLAKPDDIHGMAEAVHGLLDILVASAAVFQKTPWPEVEEDDWDFHMDINAKSTFLLVRALTPKLNDPSAVITIGDWSGLRPYKGFVPYCVSKAALIALSKSLALELAPRVRVNCVCPGTVMPPPGLDEGRVDELASSVPLERVGSPDDIVAAVRFLCGSDYATGAILPIDGGRTIANIELY